MELRIPDEVARVLAEAAEDPDREALEALLLHLIQSGWVSVAWAGERLGLGRQDAIRWYTSHGYYYPDYSEEDLEEDLRHAEGMRPRKPRGTPPERRVYVGPGQPASEAVSQGRGGRETLSEVLARVRERQAEDIGIPEEDAVTLPAGKGLSDQLLEDRHARNY